MEKEKKISLSDMMTDEPQPKKKKEFNHDSSNTKTVDLYSFVEKPAPKQRVEDVNQQKLLDKIDKNLERVAKDRIENVFKPFKEECQRLAAEAKLNGEDGPKQIFDKDGNLLPDDQIKYKPKKIKGVDEDMQVANISEDADANSTTSVEDDLAELLSEEGDNEVMENTKPLFEDKDTEIIEDIPGEDVNDEVVVENEIDEKADLEPVSETNKEVVGEVKIESSDVDIDKVTEKPLSQTKSKVANSTPTIEEAIANAQPLNISDEDLNNLLDETDEDEVEETEEEKERKAAIRKEFQAQVFEKVGAPAKVDRGRISKFKIATKPISINSVLKTNVNKASATWVLPNSGRLITLSSLSGEEIENLNRDDNGPDNVNLINRLIFNTLYNHLIDANKPETMEEWVKTINWFDVNDLYFCMYLATFKNTNFVTYTCPNKACNNIFLEEKKYTDMIKYIDDKAKETYNTLLTNGIDTTPTSIEEDIVPINDKYAIGFRAPSVYDIIFGASSLDNNFRQKYASIIGNISYMANIYYINTGEDGEGTLFPISYNAKENDPTKSMKNKIIAYYNILKNFSSDEYSIVTRTISEIDSNYNFKATYHYPDTICPKCKAEIKRADQDIPPLAMVFIRHRLVQLANSMTE